MTHHVALVRYAHVLDGIAAHHTIAAYKTINASEHLVRAATVMRVKQNNFVGLAAVDLAGMAKAQHVLGVFAPTFVAHAGLAGIERLKTLFSKRRQNLTGWNVGIPLAAAVVLGLCKDGWGYARDLVIG